MSERVEKQPVSFCRIDDAYAGQRIDNYLMARFRHVPKGHVYKWLRKGEVRVNKGRVKPVYRLQIGDEIRIPPVELPIARDLKVPSVWHQNRLAKAVIFEDDGILALNKPNGLAVHGGSGLDFGVIEVMRALRPQANFLELVHRLDKDTSGCLLLAKKRSVLRALHEAFRSNEMTKKYVALISGHLLSSRVTVKAPLKKIEVSGERVVIVSDDGKDATSHFTVLKTFEDSTLVEVRIETGRTHQIRVHALHLGCPLLGDEKYGSGIMNRRAKKAGLGRLFLHAQSIQLPLNDSEGSGGACFEAPLPEELSEFLENWC